LAWGRVESSLRLTCNFFRADDGIRTRDPHLGKVIPHILTRPASFRLVRLCR
jgi:hypothetical protein